MAKSRTKSESRRRKIRRVARRSAWGAYENDLKLHVAVERLMLRLVHERKSPVR